MRLLSNMNKSYLRTFIIVLLAICTVTLLDSCKSSKKSNSGNDNSAVKLSRKKKKRLNQSVILTSKKFIGTPYKWGGTTRAGMDCSGLLYTTYQLNNISIPRSSAAQANFGKKVGIHNLREGDWVFFATGKKRRKITHVGLVTDIRGHEDVKFIHASTSLGVTESQLFSDYWRKKYVKAIRPFR